MIVTVFPHKSQLSGPQREDWIMRARSGGVYDYIPDDPSVVSPPPAMFDFNSPMALPPSLGSGTAPVNVPRQPSVFNFDPRNMAAQSGSSAGGNQDGSRTQEVEPWEKEMEDLFAASREESWDGGMPMG